MITLKRQAFGLKIAKDLLKDLLIEIKRIS